MTRSIRVRAAMAAALLVASSGALAPEDASAQGEATATTNLTQLQRAEMPGGRPGILGFTAEQDIVGSPEPGSSLGGAVVDPSAEPDFLEGTWARGGELGAWLGAPTDAPARQFDPEVISVEGLRFRNEVTDEGPAPVPGDHLEIGMGLVPFDAPLTWSRARGATGGSLRWETTSVIQTTTSSFGGESGELDVIMFRADIFATGGDVDARREPVTVPSTLIELPRTYRSDAPFLGIAGFASPYTTYIEDFGFTPVLSAGRIEINATVAGYIPEARKKILPNGTEINEWHLPITGVIAVSTDRSLVTQAATTMPTGGEVSVVTQSGSQALDVPFAGTASASLMGESAEPETESSGEVSDLTLAVTGGHTLSEDFEASAALGRDVSSPFPLTSGEGSFTTTVDPDLRGEGFLGLVDPRSRLLKRDFADVISVPAVEVDGVRHTLTRDKLIGLTALPVRNGGGFRFMPNSANGQDPNLAATLGSRIYKEGVMVDALYDLGDGVIAEVNHQLFHGGVPPGGRANTNVVIRALDGRQLTGGAIGYGETAEVGPAFVNGTRFEEEFTSGGTIEVGRHRIAGTYRTQRSIRSGFASIFVAPAPLLGRPVDPSASIFGRRIAALITPPAVAADDAPLTIFHFGQARGIERGPQASLPLGSPCTNVAVTDGAVTDAAPTKDIRAAWFDADLSNVYVSLRLRQVPSIATSPTGDRYTVHWRDDHEGRFAEARVDQVGNWTFRAGLLGSISAPVEGEVRSGTDGVIRVAIPRYFFGYEDGILLRDIGAHSYVGTTTVREDVAPNGSSVQFGLGSDHTIELCPDLPVPTSLDFTALTPAEAVPGSPTTLQAALEDSRGIPLAGREVVFAVGGSTFEATTDELGLATASPILMLAAGSHEVRASFAGDAPYGESGATTTLVIGKATSSLNLLVEGTGVNRTLAATLHDATTGQPLGSRMIEFFADGLSLGTEQTGPDGRAVMDAPPGFRGAMHDFEARFAGDDGYEPSSAEATTSRP